MCVCVHVLPKSAQNASGFKLTFIKSQNFFELSSKKWNCFVEENF